MLVLRILSAPVAGALTLASAFCSFVLAVSTAILSFVSVIVFILALLTIFTLDPAAGIAWLVIAFLISPFGLPRFAGWLVERLDGLNSMLKDFIFG